MTATSRQKLQAVFGVLLLVSVGPASATMAGTGGGFGQAGNAGNVGAGNQPTGGGAGNQPTEDGTGTQPPTGGAGNQPTEDGTEAQPPTGGGAGNQPTDFQLGWNDSNEPNTSQVSNLGPRVNESRPFAVVERQPTDPNYDGHYEDVNGDGRINIVDSDALQRHLSSTAVGANWSAYDYTGDNRTDVGDVRWLFARAVGVPINDRDADGLPNSYERNVTGTDPDVPDSDNDGVIDGEEDQDNDTLSAYREYQLGTDPQAVDSDGDGLSDPLEEFRESLDPTASDSDGDGTVDGQEDLDGDGLAAGNETALGTSIGVKDTDGDGLDDGPEVHEYGTNATLYDTDGDGISDGDEIRVGLDPLAVDSDDDGITDSSETISTTSTDNETGVTLTMRAKGTVMTPRITPRPSYFENNSARAGPTVRLLNRTAFDNATVAMPIDESIPTSEYENLSIYTWNGSATDRWSRVETTIENGTATATVEHFSYFTVLDTDEWVGVSNVTIRADPIDLNATESFACSGACAVRNNSTVVLAGEPTSRTITVEQDGDSYEVVPLSNGETIEAFYDYGDAEVNSPLPIAKSDTSRLFFWSGPEGLSLVAIHDKPRDGDGAVVTFDMYGLPVSGSWVVQDDPSSGYRDTYGTTPDWGWNSDNTDGGAYRGGLTDTNITIDPKFNEQSPRSMERDGRITEWELLSGRATVPNNQSLALDENITIQVPDAPRDDRTGPLANDSGTATFDYTLTDRTDTVALVYQTEQIGISPTAEATITGSNGTVVSESLAIGTVGTVQSTVNVSKLAHGPVQINLTAEQVNLRATVVPRETVDTDGDGIPNSIEEREWSMPGRPGTFTTDPTDTDTDDDGLADGTEVTFDWTVTDGELQGSLSHAISHPNESDTDSDGLNDGQELTGWTYNVTNTSTDEPYRWEPSAAEANGTLHVTANPLQADSDGDGLSDSEERNQTHTDPEKRVTYELTSEHQELLADAAEARFISWHRITPADTSLDNLISNGLTDATDDSDFVTTDGPISTSELTFEAMDGTVRTDSWLSNEDEVRAGTDPWDPDTDDDGLTDGWEADGITTYHTGRGAAWLTRNSDLASTDPTDPDTDGDGYWDGWIGVYDVGYTDNVVLYREHLQSGGITGDEIVVEQGQYHEVPEVASAMGADIDDDGVLEHSNIHIGERHWSTVGGSTTSPIDTIAPSPSLDVEVDYHESYDQSLVHSTAEVSDIYALYGVDVSYSIDEEVTTAELRDIGNPTVPGGSPTAPHVFTEANDIEAEFHDTSGTVYLFLSPDGESKWESIGGTASSGGNGFPPFRNFGMFVFEDDLTSANQKMDHQATVAHETGHILAVGRNDDATSAGRIWEEVYSGSPEDDTPEDLTVVSSSSGNQYSTAYWSIMRSGYGPAQLDMPPSSTHSGTIRFSIEELLTIETENMPSEAHSRLST